MLNELEVLKIIGERLEIAHVPFMLTGSFAMAYYAGHDARLGFGGCAGDRAIGRDAVVAGTEPMTDTSPKIEAMIKERYRQMTPDERVRIAASMFETARAIVLSSLPQNLSREERRLALAKRFYGNELPEKALIAHAEWDDK